MQDWKTRDRNFRDRKYWTLLRLSRIFRLCIFQFVLHACVAADFLKSVVLLQLITRIKCNRWPLMINQVLN